MTRTGFIEHGGKQVLLQDFSKLADVAEGLLVIAAARAFVAGTGAGHDGVPKLLVLTSVGDSAFDPRIVEALKELANHHRPYVRASAVIGLNGVTRLMLRIVAMFSGRVIKAFETREQALDWLVQQ